MDTETTEIPEDVDRTTSENRPGTEADDRPGTATGSVTDGVQAEPVTLRLPEGAGPLIPDQEFVTQLLEQLQLKHTVDDEGDMVAPWQDFRVYFMFRGGQDEHLFSVRTFYDRPFPPEDKAKVLEWIDDWNQRTLWPKVCTYTPEDGQFRLVGEAQTLIGTGVDPQHFVACTVSWIQGSLEFDRFLAQQLGLPIDGLGLPIDGPLFDREDG
jgi:hypothetical protein